MAASKYPACEPNVTVEYEEDDESPKEGYTREGLSFVATRTLFCAWPDRHTLAEQLIGDSVNFPAQYPHGNQYARVSTVDMEGVGKPDITNSDEFFEKAKLIISYKIYTVETTTEVDVRLEPSSEFLTLPVNGLQWSDGTPLNETEAPAKLIQMFDLVYTKKYILLPSWFGTIEGCVNHAPVTSSLISRTFAAETLLAGKPELSKSITNKGSTMWTITMRFTYRSIGWNKFPRSENANADNVPFELIYNADGVAIRVFHLANLSDIVE